MGFKVRSHTNLSVILEKKGKAQTNQKVTNLCPVITTCWGKKIPFLLLSSPAQAQELTSGCWPKRAVLSPTFHTLFIPHIPRRFPLPFGCRWKQQVRGFQKAPPSVPEGAKALAAFWDAPASPSTGLIPWGGWHPSGNALFQVFSGAQL